jgi:hypothetical protein
MGIHHQQVDRVRADVQDTQSHTLTLLGPRANSDVLVLFSCGLFSRGLLSARVVELRGLSRAGPAPAPPGPSRNRPGRDTFGPEAGCMFETAGVTFITAEAAMTETSRRSVTTEPGQ